MTLTNIPSREVIDLLSRALVTERDVYARAPGPRDPARERAQDDARAYVDQLGYFTANPPSGQTVAMGGAPPSPSIGDTVQTKTPGQRTRVILDIAEASLELLLRGQETTKTWLQSNDDGTVTLHANTHIGTTRASGVKPVADIAVECLNQLLSAIDDANATPTSVLHVADAVRQRWENYGGEFIEGDPVAMAERAALQWALEHLAADAPQSGDGEEFERFAAATRLAWPHDRSKWVDSDEVSP